MNIKNSGNLIMKNYIAYQYGLDFNIFILLNLE